MKNKVCVSCLKDKPFSDFIRQSSKKDGHQNICRTCATEYKRNWYYRDLVKNQEKGRKNTAVSRSRARQKDPLVHVKADLRRNFGLSWEDYQAIVAAQENLCAICKNPAPGGRRLSVDHDHKTGQVRDLLCVRCNAGLGNFLESSELLNRAIS